MSTTTLIASVALNWTTTTTLMMISVVNGGGGADTNRFVDNASQRNSNETSVWAPERNNTPTFLGYFVYLFGITIFCAFGIVSNSLNIIILTRPRLTAGAGSVYYYLMGNYCCDQGFLVYFILELFSHVLLQFGILCSAAILLFCQNDFSQICGMVNL